MKPIIGKSRLKWVRLPFTGSPPHEHSRLRGNVHERFRYSKTLSGHGKITPVFTGAIGSIQPYEFFTQSLQLLIKNHITIYGSLMSIDAPGFRPVMAGSSAT
jgi:hypothetical protein